MDPLKKYLKQYREELDIDTPGDEVWQRIQERTPPAPPKKGIVKRLSSYAVAAGIAACLAIGIFLLQKQPGELPGRHDNGPAKILQPAIVHVQPHPVDASPAHQEKTEAKNEAAKSRTHKKNGASKSGQPAGNPALRLVQQVERAYAQRLNTELERLRTTPVYAESPEYFSAFQQQYHQVGNDEAVIRNDIQEQGLNDELLQQLININQQKLNVLKDLQTEIEKLNRKVGAAQDAQAGNRGFYLTI